MITSLPQTIICRPAHSDDISALVALCARWQRDQLDTTQNGFLSAAFGPTVFQSMIEKRHLTVADNNGSIIAYYACNNFSNDGVLTLHLGKVEECRNLGLISSDARVGLGLQALVDKEYQGHGLRTKLLNLLLEQLRGQYDYIFSTISKENTRAFRAHSKDGWKAFTEDEQVYSVFLPVE